MKESFLDSPEYHTLPPSEALPTYLARPEGAIDLTYALGSSIPPSMELQWWPKPNVPQIFDEFDIVPDVDIFVSRVPKLEIVVPDTMASQGYVRPMYLVKGQGNEEERYSGS